MKRILFMHHSSSIGGGSFCLLNLVKVMDRTTCEPIVALKTHGALEEELKKIGIRVILFPRMSQIPYNESLFSFTSIRIYISVFRSLKACEEMLQREEIDIVYLNNMMITPYLLPAKKIGCKTILHVREHWPLNEHTRQLEWIRRLVYKNCDKLIAINRFSASIFPKKEATVVYDWIEMEGRYKEMPLGKIFKDDMKDKKVLLYTGGAQAIKGIDYIVDAFTNEIKGDNYRLLLLGCDDLLLSGWKHNAKRFLSYFGYHYWGQELLRRIERDPRICRTCMVYELNHLIEQSFCFISYFTIPHANLALAENIILGNACIAADSEEAREYTNNGEFAKLVSPLNNYDIFCKELKEFLSNVEEWRERAKVGSLEVNKMFSPKENIMRLNEAISDLIQNN